MEFLSPHKPVAYAGDVNNDGFDDIILGHQATILTAFNLGGSISSMVLYKARSPRPMPMRLFQAQPLTNWGRAVSPAGDLNEDGFDDISLGTDAAGGSVQGPWVKCFSSIVPYSRTAASADAIITGSFANESLDA
jgi:hypothetical protein